MKQPATCASARWDNETCCTCVDWLTCYRWNSRLLVHLPGETMRLVAPVLIDWLATGETAGYLCICQVRQWDLLHLYWLIDLLQVKQLATCASARWDSETLCTCVDWLIDRLAAGETADYLYICQVIHCMNIMHDLYLRYIASSIVLREWLIRYFAALFFLSRAAQ